MDLLKHVEKQVKKMLRALKSAVGNLYLRYNIVIHKFDRKKMDSIRKEQFANHSLPKANGEICFSTVFSEKNGKNQEY